MDAGILVPRASVRLTRRRRLVTFDAKMVTLERTLAGARRPMTATQPLGGIHGTTTRFLARLRRMHARPLAAVTLSYNHHYGVCMNRLSQIVSVAVAATCLLSLAPAFAAGWPDKPVKVIVPFGPGGTTDTLVRKIQRVAEEKKLMPQPLTIINVGGHFSVGGNQVKNAAPDGYTFLVMHLALLSGEIVDPNRKLSYRDFEPVALTGGFCLHPVVRDDAPWKTLAGTAGGGQGASRTPSCSASTSGALNHLGGGMLEAAFPGAKFRFVQIGGGAENFAALKGGNTQVGMLSSSEYQNFKSGGVRALGYTGTERLELEPEIPTMRELGLDFDFCINNYWLAPKGTPKEAVDGMAAMLQKAMASARNPGGAGQAGVDRPSSCRGDGVPEESSTSTFRPIEPVAKSLVKK